MKKKKDENYIDFGQWIYELRKEKGLSEEQLKEKINMVNVQEINIKKWERDLEFPEIEVIYKLSEIYMISSAEIIDKKQKNFTSRSRRNTFLYYKNFKFINGNIYLWNNLVL